jgi:hypothetical protein
MDVQYLFGFGKSEGRQGDCFLYYGIDCSGNRFQNSACDHTVKKHARQWHQVPLDAMKVQRAGIHAQNPDNNNRPAFAAKKNFR